MIKILILTDKIYKWYYFILNMMEIDSTLQTMTKIMMQNKLFTFYIQSDFNESMRGAAFAHVIEDKDIDIETFCDILLPTIKQRVTQYGSRTILEEIDK